MSIPVDLAALAEALTRHDVAYLLTGGEGRPHVAEVFPELVDGMLVIAEPGRTARRVVEQQPAMTVLLPPRSRGGYTLLVDGAGSLAEDGALLITPSHAVLHRAAAHGRQDVDAAEGGAAEGRAAEGGAGDSAACGNDCRPLDTQP